MHQEKEAFILDKPEIQAKPKDYNWLGYSSLGVLTIGVALQMFHFRFWIPLVLLGMAGMTTRSILLFLQKKRPIFAWFYFTGRILLFVAAGLYFSKLIMDPRLFYLPLVCFLIGLGFVMFSKKDVTDESTDDI
jgi:hypothetical protein